MGRRTGRRAAPAAELVRVTVRVERLFAGCPPVGTVVTVVRTPYLESLIAHGFVTDVEGGRR